MNKAAVVLALVLPAGWLRAENPQPGRNAVVVRGQRQDVYYYPAAGKAKGKVLFAPGDGGWRGFAVAIAQTIAGWGYDVYGLDTKRYLESFTGRSTLKESEVMRDFRQMAEWALGGANERVLLAGWSEGAGLALLGAAGPDGTKPFSGLIAIGLPEAGVLGWRWTDNVTYVTRTEPNEPHFSTAQHLPKVAPLPLAVIQSSGDEYTALETVRRLFAGAREPKKLVLVEARNHRFDGNREEFFRALRQSFEWISQATR